MNTNRIGEACWYLIANSKAGDWRRGRLLTWGQDYEGDMKAVTIPVGVIEDCETHRVHSTYVEWISFADVKPE